MNELRELHELFAASVGAAAALIGLLFVAISVDPEKIFGSNAEIKRRSDAERAFTALGNVFFVSLTALLAHNLRATMTVIAVLAIVQTVRSGWKMYGRGRGLRHTGIISLCVYAFEFFAALSLNASDASAERIVYIVFGLYGYALVTSWGLLSINVGRA